MYKKMFYQKMFWRTGITEIANLPTLCCCPLDVAKLPLLRLLASAVLPVPPPLECLPV